MKQRFTAARVLAGIIAAAATLGATRAPHVALPPGVQTTGEIRLILRGAQQGQLFTNSCGATSSGEFKAFKFTDLTDPNAPADVGTFSMDVPAACIAPLLTALYHHEALSGAIGFFDAREQPVLAFSLGTAYIAHVASSFDQASREAQFVTIEVVSPAWTAFVPRVAPGVHGRIRLPRQVRARPRARTRTSHRVHRRARPPARAMRSCRAPPFARSPWRRRASLASTWTRCARIALASVQSSPRRPARRGAGVRPRMP